jgi:two-component system OmpR family response regulator
MAYASRRKPERRPSADDNSDATVEHQRMRVLVVENDLTTAKLIRSWLMTQALAVDVAIRGEDALWMAGATDYDAIALDAQLPGIDGFETCRRLRADGVRSPVLMLSWQGGVEDRVAGLDGGADDYLVKPFYFDELAARLRALMRRGSVERPTMIEVGDLRLDPATRRVWRGSTEIKLSAKQFALLVEFMRRPGRVLSRFLLLEHAWDGQYENRSNVVDVYVRYLRNKIDRPFGIESLETVRGVGYRLRDASVAWDAQPRFRSRRTDRARRTGAGPPASAGARRAQSTS